MASFDAATLMALWEHVGTQHPVDGALTLLAADDAGTERQQLKRLPIGERDRRLLVLYEKLFGHRLAGIGHCVHCGEPIDLEWTTDDLLALSGSDSEAFPIAGYEITCRLPDSIDMAAVATGDGSVDPGDALLSRCVLRIRRNGREHSFDELPASVVAELAERVAAADPLAVPEMLVDCPSCAAGNTFGFDILGFLKARIEDRARRLITEVHCLAAAYGWSERDILALGDGRRRAYLALVQS